VQQSAVERKAAVPEQVLIREKSAKTGHSVSYKSYSLKSYQDVLQRDEIERDKIEKGDGHQTGVNPNLACECNDRPNDYKYRSQILGWTDACDNKIRKIGCT